MTANICIIRIDGLTISVVNDTALTVVDRRNLEALRLEMNFQISGEVNEATAQAVGRILGAQSIISGYIERMGDMYRLQIQSIEVETAKIQGMQNFIITDDPILSALLGEKSTIRKTNNAYRKGMRNGEQLHWLDENTRNNF